ncbi:hypothetical protein NDU88_001576 [Pleurodeles waltl]|uniref:Uncharacterized protein n=1 Tax=Pleurodeles waltl TaxID=8319 RepID=A0AAV7WMV0_PLEWA|nr:hypothetical protein NDU88_001576 [Pleurodeles waltl]
MVLRQGEAAIKGRKNERRISPKTLARSRLSVVPTARPMRTVVRTTRKTRAREGKTSAKGNERAKRLPTTTPHRSPQKSGEPTLPLPLH